MVEQGVAGTIISKFKGLPNTVKALAIGGGIVVGTYVFIKAYNYIKGYLGTSAASTIQQGLAGLNPFYGGYDSGNNNAGYTGASQPSSSQPTSYAGTEGATLAPVTPTPAAGKFQPTSITYYFQPLAKTNHLPQQQPYRTVAPTGREQPSY